MRMTIIFANAALVALAAVQSGCGRSESARSASADTMSGVMSGTAAGPSASATAMTSSAIAAPDESIVIHTTGNEVLLGLANDTVYMGLSDSVLTKTRAEMKRDRDTSGMGGAFADMIKRTVGNALGKRVTYPISDIQSVRYDKGEIKFDYRHKHTMSFESVSANNKKALASFAPANAERFVAAVNAALKSDDSAP